MTEDDSRIVRVEVEVPGTPEQVWEAIATGPGIETWFVPAEVEGREGGEIVTHHGPFGDSRGVVTGWDPPRRFAYEERDWNPPEAVPPWATEILVEARAGGTCVVRLVSGIFSDGSDWADHIDPTEGGWRAGLENLRIYLTHFAGLPVASLFVLSRTSAPTEQTRAELLDALGLAGAAVGDRVRASAAAPPLAGVVEQVTDELVTLRAETPAPGLFGLFVHDWGGVTNVFARGYFYGDGGPAAVAREQPAWEEWLAARFPEAEAA